MSQTRRHWSKSVICWEMLGTPQCLSKRIILCFKFNLQSQHLNNNCNNIWHLVLKKKKMLRIYVWNKRKQAYSRMTCECIIGIVGANWSHRYCSCGKGLGLWPNIQSEDKSVFEDDQQRKKWKLFYWKR